MNQEIKRQIAMIQHNIAQEVRDIVITFQRYGIPYTSETIQKFFSNAEEYVKEWIEIEKDGRESTQED